MKEYKNRNGEVVLRYDENDREKALSVSLSFLARQLGFTPVSAGSRMSLKEIDSLIIYDDKTWNRFSERGSITGGSQIDFMMAFGSADTVPEAIKEILQCLGEHPDQEMRVDEKPELVSNSTENRTLRLPPKNTNYRRVYAYLIKTRGLSQEIVHDFIHRGLIYEDANHHNIVFCGYGPDGSIKYAGLRGTADLYGKKFKIDVPGNDKNYGINIINKESSELKVFESVIDCMSYIDMTGDNFSNKLVLGMVADNPLVQLLKDYDHIKKITFCLDNDRAGREALLGHIDNGRHRLGYLAKYRNWGYEVSAEIPQYGCKDFNESLISHKSDKYDNPTIKRHRSR